MIHAGHLLFLEKYGFQKYLNRGILLAAFVLLWPMLRWLRQGGAVEWPVRPDIRRGRNLGVGIVLGAGAMLILASSYLASGIYQWNKELPLGKIAAAAISAVVVSVLEETLFRGGMTGLFRRSMSEKGALWATTLIFAAVHFIRPDPSIQVESVSWSSGFLLLPHSFHQFANPALLMGGLVTLVLFGWILGEAARRTGALWMSIGIHAGLVFVKLGFERWTEKKQILLPWTGPELQIGLIPVAVLSVMAVAMLWSTRDCSTWNKTPQNP